eukprot:COSAG01_NODE_93_length_27013_cov_41.515791_16_plen_161_part_00
MHTFLGGTLNMDLKNIKNLVKLVEDADISHLCVEQDGMKIEVKKEINIAQNIVAQAPIAAPVPAAAPVAAPEAASAQASNNFTPIKAEMVGTFYASPNPESDAFVKVGSSIKPGDIVYIIEAMKLFNEVESEWSGTIKEICVKNGDAVEFGQTLFLLEEN